MPFRVGVKKGYRATAALYLLVRTGGTTKFPVIPVFKQNMINCRFLHN